MSDRAARIRAADSREYPAWNFPASQAVGGLAPMPALTYRCECGHEMGLGQQMNRAGELICTACSKAGAPGLGIDRTGR